MTPQERQMIEELFDRLARVESATRDPQAEAAIAQEWQRAPNAAYALVQTVLVQDEALKRANARIQELEGAGAAPEQNQQGSFLDSMRGSMFGQGQSRGSVPNVPPPPSSGRPAWNTGQVLGQQGGPQDQYGAPPPMQQGGGGGGSFLGTAAAAAAGAVGGSLLLNSIRSMMGGGHQGFGDGGAFAGGRSGGGNPWSSDQSGGSLARDAGVNDVGSSNRSDGDRSSQFDQAQADADQDQDQDQDDEDDFADDESDDFDDGGDSDYA